MHCVRVEPIIARAVARWSRWESTVMVGHDVSQRHCGGQQL